jgi:heme o synthase
VLQFALGGILRKSSLLAVCESTMSFWSCWQRQAEIPLAGSLAIIHRTLGLITTFSGFFVFFYLIKHLPRWKWSALLGLAFMVLQLLLGLQMGRSSGREMIFWHFALALGSFCVLVFLLSRVRRYEWHFFSRPVPTYLNDLMDLFKPRLTILVVVTVLVGVFLAPARTNIVYLIISLVAIWFQAAGSLCLNSYIEREADKHMERTKDRPLPSGRLDPRVALYWGWGLIAFGTLVLILSANLLTAALGVFAALSYLYVYTPMKLRSPYALYIGAIPGALPTIMGWTTVTNELSAMAIYLFGVLFLWQIPHFMAISLYRKDEYSMARFLTFAQTHSYQFLRSNIFLYSIFLLGFGLLPYVWVWRGVGYLYSSLMVGVILSLWGLISWMYSDEQRFKTWARSYFFATLFYLPLQLGLLLVLR